MNRSYSNMIFCSSGILEDWEKVIKGRRKKEEERKKTAPVNIVERDCADEKKERKRKKKEKESAGDDFFESKSFVRKLHFAIDRLNSDFLFFQ